MFSFGAKRVPVKRFIRKNFSHGQLKQTDQRSHRSAACCSIVLLQKHFSPLYARGFNVKSSANNYHIIIIIWCFFSLLCTFYRQFITLAFGYQGMFSLHVECIFYEWTLEAKNLQHFTNSTIIIQQQTFQWFRRESFRFPDFFPSQSAILFTRRLHRQHTLRVKWTSSA